MQGRIVLSIANGGQHQNGCIYKHRRHWIKKGWVIHLRDRAASITAVMLWQLRAGQR